MRNEPAIVFPKRDFSRVPYAVYHDEAVYAAEHEKIFKGPTWLYVGLAAEVPNAGDFRTTRLGETPVVFNRGSDGKVHAFVNRCAHRGAIVRREPYGNAKDHTCIYHRWAYDLEGNLLGVPFQRGVNGKGGLAPDFDKAAHGLRKLRVEDYHGVVFATFAADPEPLVDYLGPHHARHLARLFAKPVKVIGYQRQVLYGNWKLYNENVRDQYHGSLLHEFITTFGISRVTQNGGAWMDPRHRHSISWSEEGSDSTAEANKLYAEAKVKQGVVRLHEEEFLDYRREYPDKVSITICSVFPNVTFQQIRNALATRQIRPKRPGETELYWTLFGYQDDTPDMTRHRLLQSNLAGPAGLISMEDGEAVEITYRGTVRDRDAHSVVEMGGGGAIPTDVTIKVSDIPLRGFWSYWAELMGYAPEGAVR
ncbi:MAG: Rieske 2Fe-2S domain-containing protein [Alphaproteobacteria bacterium]|nr:Rieske 2Fe-2S domain-containing protein [Alphaproteobacteria bacterium]